MKVTYKEGSEKVGNLTKKQLQVLYVSKPFSEVKKLFKGYDSAEIQLDGEFVNVKFIMEGKPGFYMKKFYIEFIEIVQNKWVDSPILNRSGLATLLWNDLIPNNLRRRLEQKRDRNTFTEKEKVKIIKEVDKFSNQVKKSLSIGAKD